MDTKKIGVRLEGLSDIMFDRFYDYSEKDRSPEKKIYLNDEKELVLPSENIMSFLFRDLPPVGVIRFVEKRSAKDFIAIGQSHVAITPPILIPFLDGNNKKIVFSDFDKMKNYFYINTWSAGLTKMAGGKVIKQEVRKRPVLKLPWSLEFEIMLFPNDKVTSDKLLSWFEVGGLVTALGTYRPRHGRFMVKKWEIVS